MLCRMPRFTMKGFVVGLPIASLDREQRPLPRAVVEQWTARAQQELTECFGGATVLPAPGASAASGDEPEPGQVMVVAGCDSRAHFLAQRLRLQAFAVRLKEALGQETVLVLAFESESFLVEDSA
jgi:hypothetical protein